MYVRGCVGVRGRVNVINTTLKKEYIYFLFAGVDVGGSSGPRQLSQGYQGR